VPSMVWIVGRAPAEDEKVSRFGITKFVITETP